MQSPAVACREIEPPHPRRSRRRPRSPLRAKYIPGLGHSWSIKTYHVIDGISRSQLVRHWDVLRHQTDYRDRDRIKIW
ncbi:MAG: hypothetical protein QOG92_2620 [Verrucomicrobiota bacterium]|jgi:hypothetical protein|nr:hypothetical protein [Verrucomicrobiota bacterium]